MTGTKKKKGGVRDMICAAKLCAKLENGSKSNGSGAGERKRCEVLGKKRKREVTDSGGN